MVLGELRRDDLMITVLIKGKIYIEKNNFQEAILIEDGIIKEIGSNKQILKNHYDEVVDLKGKTVLPGFNDSHLHLVSIGDVMNLCDLTEAESIADIISLGKEFLENNKDITVLYGRGWNQDYFIKGESRLINRFDLDKISKDIPIVFSRVCCHVAVGNTKALEILAIDENISVSGGTIELDSDGKPNGIFNENAVGLIQSIIPKKTDYDIEEDFLKAQDYALSLGITSVQSSDVTSKNYQNMFSILHNLYNDNRLKLRYSHQFNFQDINDLKIYLQTEDKTGKYDEQFLSKGVLKLFKDGSLGARTALMLEDYKDDPGNKGVSALSDEGLQELCDLASANNITIITHAIGDGAVESVINAYERTMKNKKNPLRHGIVHCQITNKDHLERIKALKIPIMFQPIFLEYDRHIVESRISKELAGTSYAFNTLYKSGVPISLGTDAPIEDCNPFPNIYCAVTRLGLDGKPEGGFYPKERMKLTDAIDAYTFGSAYNEFKEAYKGRLKEGYLADLIILDRDIFTIDEKEIKDIKVDKTMVHGKFVYEK